MRRATCTLLSAALVLSMLLAACASPQATPTTAAPTTVKPPTTTAVVPTTTAPKPTPTPTASPALTPQYGGTLTVIESVASNGILGNQWDGGDQEPEQFAMDHLWVEQSDGSPGPALAESWDVNSDPAKASLTFHLRKGVKFQDGTDWNAKSFQWNIAMFKDPGKYSPGSTPRYTSMTDYWQSVDIIDDYTVRLNFPMWRNSFMRAFDSYYMASQTAFDKNGNTWMKTHMVGTGPFMQTDLNGGAASYQQDVSLTMVKNPNYYMAGRPYMDGVVLKYVTDELTRSALMQSGGADMLSAGAKIASQQFKTGYPVLGRPGGPWMLAPDSLNADSPWAKKEVRQALSYALDRDALAKVFGYGYGGPASQMADPKNLSYDPALPAIKQDTAKAKQLLAAAGYPSGFKTRIICAPQGLDRDSIIAIQAQMDAVGITSDITYPTAAQMATINGPTTVMTPSNALIYEVSQTYANPNTTYNVYYADPGAFQLFSLKKPDGWKDLYAKSAVTPKPDQAITKSVTDAFYNDQTIIPIFYSSTVVVTSPRLHDSGLLSYGLASRWNLQTAWLSK